MKVTICFDDIKVIVPCGSRPGNEQSSSKLKVVDIIENSIAKYRKASGKVSVRPHVEKTIVYYLYI